MVFNVIEKRGPVFLPLVFAARKASGFLHTQYPENEAKKSHPVLVYEEASHKRG